MSTELAVIEPEYVDVFDEPDPIAADTVKSDIETLLTSIRNHELRLATSHAKLGRQLLRVQQDKLWVPWGFQSFGSYIDSVRQQIDKGRSQIYNCISVADKLLPAVCESDLDSMGISRAQELARFVKQSGRKVPERLLLLALDDTRTIEELHSAVLEELHEKAEVRGAWHQPIGGSYYTQEEKLEVQQAMSTARNVLGLGSDIPDHQAHKLILLAFAQEFVSSNPMEG
jgi:hypothetical protein